MFHVRRRPADYVPRKRKKKPSGGKWNELEHRYEDERLPFLQEINPDGTDIPNGAGMRHRLQPNVTEVGSERPIGPQAVQAQTLTLQGPTVMPRHCVIAFTENIVTLTPCSRDAHTYVNNQRIHQTTILHVSIFNLFGIWGCFFLFFFFFFVFGSFKFLKCYPCTSTWPKHYYIVRNINGSNCHIFLLFSPPCRYFFVFF